MENAEKLNFNKDLLRNRFKKIFTPDNLSKDSFSFSLPFKGVETSFFTGVGKYHLKLKFLSKDYNSSKNKIGEQLKTIDPYLEVDNMMPRIDLDIYINDNIIDKIVDICFILFQNTNLEYDPNIVASNYKTKEEITNVLKIEITHKMEKEKSEFDEMYEKLIDRNNTENINKITKIIKNSNILSTHEKRDTYIDLMIDQMQEYGFNRELLDKYISVMDNLDGENMSVVFDNILNIHNL